MKSNVVRLVDRLLSVTRLEYFPVKVRSGIAAGAQWTFYPWSAYWRGTQEAELHQALHQLGDITGWSCWDLGAHFGIYAVGLARKVGANGQVAAFEPNPLSYGRLEHHRKMNSLSCMKTFCAAVSDQAGTTEFYTYGNLKGTTTHLPYENETPDASTKPIDVKTVVLDDLVSAGELRLPDFVKIDVEGHAHRALAGARQSLQTKRPIMIVAMHSDHEVRGVRDILEPLGYTHRLIKTISSSPDELIGHDVLFTPPRS